jgi:hypothetical protein
VWGLEREIVRFGAASKESDVAGLPAKGYPPQKLEDVERFSMGMGVEGIFTRAIGFVEEGLGAGSPMDAGEADGATK